MNWYDGKKAVITGGSSGIGKAAAKFLTQWGADVCICARDAVKLEQTVAEIRSAARSIDVKIISMIMDVADRRQVRAAAPEAVKLLGGMDILINCAGITWPGYFKDIPDGIWDSIMQIDYMGTVNTVRAFAPYLIEQKHGNIINVASVVGYMGVFGYAAYSPAKFAVVGFSECLRQELLPHNIRVSVIYPPDTDTPQWHEENRTKPQETRALAGAIKVLPASKVAYCLLRGARRGSFSIVPGAMNKFTYFVNRFFPPIAWLIIKGTLLNYWKKLAKRSLTQ
jgi:3-dehydrosphinganine reductase